MAKWTIRIAACKAGSIGATPFTMGNRPNLFEWRTYEIDATTRDDARAKAIERACVVDHLQHVAIVQCDVDFPRVAPYLSGGIDNDE